MRGRKKRTLILGILCCLLVFMGVGFAVARTTLNIGGTSTAINTWDVRIANITVGNKSDSVTNNEENTKIGDDGVSANLQADFVQPGDYINYEVLVENNGSIDATLNNLAIEITPSVETDKDLYIVESTMPENAKLEAGKSITFTITITFNKDAEKLPEGDVNFGISLDYSQGNIPEGGGNTPGEGTESEKDWDFEVDENGTITAYNYDLGTDVVVPATNYEGKEITTITEQSFIPQGNADMYYNEDPTGMYVLIRENEPNFTYAKDKFVAMFLLECSGDTACEEQYKSMIYVCKDSDTCYNILNMEQNAEDSTVELLVTSIPDTAVSEGGGYINPDPDVPLGESMVELTPNVTTLDLSKATNLTTIESYALEEVGLESVEFGDNSNVTSIGNYAFSSNALTSVEIPASVETIGSSAFQNNQIETLTLGTTTEVENQLNKNNRYSLSRLGTTVEKIATTNSKLKSIGNSAFYNNKIQSLALPYSLERIGSYAFQSNQISGELVLPKNLTTIEEAAFYNNQISTMYLPKNVTILGTNAFYGNAFETLTIEKCTTTICISVSGNSGSVYPYTKFFGNNIKNLIIESGEIGTGAFYTSSTTKIKSLTLGENVTYIGDSAFKENEITELIIPKTVTTIGESAFYKNQISGTLIIPEAVTSIGRTAFSSNSIDSLYIEKCSNLCVAYDDNGNSLQWIGSIANLAIRSGEIGDYAFSGMKIQNLTLEEGVTSIGIEAFYNSCIESLIIPSTVTYIGDRTFDYQWDSSSHKHVLSSILIKRAEEEFLANVTVGTDWYDNSLNPTITFDPS